MPTKNIEYTTEVSKRFITALNRLKENIPAAEIYTKLGVSRAYVHRIGKGDRHPTIDHLVKLCSFYKVSAEWLLLGRGEPVWDEKTETFNARLDRLEKMMDNFAEMIATLTVRGLAGGAIGIRVGK